MSPGVPDLFGQPLVADPELALLPFDIDIPAKAGPLHKVQYVIEFVGQRSVLASQAAQLLSPDWFQALGKPQIYAMRPADLQWQELTPSVDGSYDSLALAWNLLAPSGALTKSSAQHLLDLAERFGPYIQRRAMPMPVPNDVNTAVRGLMKIKDMLDIGFELSVMSSRGEFKERDLWIECVRLGLTFSPGGSFDWRVPGHPMPLFSVTPIGQTDAFSLSGVQRGIGHVGVTLGFSVPLCIAPTQAFEAALYVAQMIANDLGGRVLDDADREVTPGIKDELERSMKEAVSLFSHSGMTTGSAESMAIFS